MKRTLILLAIILCATIPAIAQQSGYGGDGKAQDGAAVSSFIRLYETPPTAATLAAGGAGTTTTGAHIVKVTCYTPGGETNGGTASSSVDTATAQFAISAIPLCSSIATGRRVYMNTVAAPTVFNRVSNGQIANNTATTLTVTDNDATIAGGAALPTSNTALDVRLTIGQSSSTFAVPILYPSGTVAVPGIAFSAGTTTGFFKPTSGIGVSVAGAEGTWLAGAIIYQPYAGGFAFSSSNSTSSGGTYWKLAMDGTGDTAVLVGNVAGGGFLQNTGGEGTLTAAYTDADATLGATNLSYTLRAGRSYRIKGLLQVSNTTAAEGVQFAFDGGSATITTFFVAATAISGTVVAGTTSATSIATPLTFTTTTGTCYIAIDGYVKINAAGTFILRAAEATTATGTVTIGAGSWIALSDTALK